MKRTPHRPASALIALLRGVNVGGHKKVPMSELREVLSGIGCRSVATYIQSGNAVFSSDMMPEEAETAIEQAISSRFGFAVAVVVRTLAGWRAYETASVFAEAQTARPHLLLLGLPKRPPRPDAAEKLRVYAKAGEQIEIVDDGIWIDFATAIGSSKLTPAVIDRIVGSTVTARNWTTVQKLGEMARALD